MSVSSKESPWFVIRRCLAILRRLARGPASGTELIAWVRAQVGSQAYSDDPAAAHRAFKGDRQRLREHLGVSWTYDRRADAYELTSPGELALLDLPDDHLAALAVVYTTFEAHESAHVPIKPLLDYLAGLLPPDRRQALEQAARVTRVDMPELDQAAIPVRVWDTIERAIQRRRQLAFNYYSPQQADRLPRTWVVAPVELRFRRGHWYLRCWQISWHSHVGEGYNQAWRQFRLQYIANDDRLEVLPARIAVEHLQPPRIFVHYLLKPVVGRGDISRHFREMTVERRPDGWAEVKGVCDDAWDAVRTLLGYGESCVVLGGEEVLSAMRRRVRGMAENYGFWGNSQG